jgi:hypothetical protein
MRLESKGSTELVSLQTKERRIHCDPRCVAHFDCGIQRGTVKPLFK